MTKYLVPLMILVAMLTLPMGLYAQETDPVAVVTARAEAMNAGDVDAATAFFAEDAVYNIAPPQPPGVPPTFNGRDEIRGRLADLVDLNARMEIVITESEGDKVTTRTTYWADDITALGLPFLIGIEEYTIQDGQITLYTYTMTEESLAQVMAAMPPETLPASGGQAFPTYALLAALGGIAILGGLGLGLQHRHSRPQ